MPEIVQRTLICDKPRCENEGKRYMIDDGVTPMAPILCDKHAGSVSVTEALTLGEPAPMARTRRNRGLSESRLESLIDREE